MLSRAALALILLAAFAPAGLAATKDESEIDVKTREVAKTLRCTVCQTESIWESGSPFAAEVRKAIRERVAQGQSGDEIRAYFLSRYGDYILMQPPTRGVNWLIWTGPFALLLVGGVLLYRTLRRWVAATTPPVDEAMPLDERARRRIEQELRS